VTRLPCQRNDFIVVSTDPMTLRPPAPAPAPIPAGRNANIIDSLCFVSVTPRLYVTLTPRGKLAPL
jgi:hypothetical protein